MHIRFNSAHMLTTIALAAIIVMGLYGHAYADDDFSTLMQSASNRVLTGWQYGLNVAGFVCGSGMLFGSLISIYLKHSGKGMHQVGYGAIVSAALVGTLLFGFTVYEGVLSRTLIGQRGSITGVQQKITFDQ